MLIYNAPRARTREPSSSVDVFVKGDARGLGSRVLSKIQHYLHHGPFSGAEKTLCKNLNSRAPTALNHWIWSKRKLTSWFIVETSIEIEIVRT